MFSMFSANLKELKEKKASSTITAGISIAPSSAPAAAHERCSQAILKLPIKYSGRDDSRCVHVEHICVSCVRGCASRRVCSCVF
mmetsp:Transcript_92/g.181  ORF Transcript_92/g.181 Transcript_92/m.181 type:complete len:84 (-) Transcript_92:431-682(-)